MQFKFLFSVCFMLILTSLLVRGQSELNNNKFFRGISNGLDKVLPKDGRLREGIHGVYHEGMYRINGNAAEHERAKDKFHWGGRTDHLNNFRKNHPGYRPGGHYNSKETN